MGAKQIESDVQSEVKAALNVAVHAAVGALLSYVAARVAGSHSAVLDAVWATAPVTFLVAWLKNHFS